MIRILLIIVSIILTGVLTKTLNPLLKWRAFVRARKMKKTYIPNNDIVFGTASYDFFDHEDKAYLSELIKITILDEEEIKYNFQKSFSTNCKYHKKLQDIKSFIENSSILTERLNGKNIDEIVHEIIERNDFNIDDDRTTYIINNILKSRKDDLLRPEAGTLNIGMIKTNVATSNLIDSLYKYLYRISPEVMERHFKRNIQSDIEYKEHNDIICFMTSLTIQGFVVTKKDNNIQILTHNTNTYSYRIEIDASIIDTNTRLNGAAIKEIIIDHINKNFADTIKDTKFTDIAISYKDGVHCEILSFLISTSITNPRETHLFTVTSLNDNYCQFRDLIKKEEINDNKKEFAYLYLWSIIRKMKYKHI